MKVSEFTKQAADFVQKREAEEKAIKDREKDATAKLAELEAQAEHLAQERKFDEYAENMESQRKQKNIIDLVKKIGRKTPEQKEEDNATVKGFCDQAQQAFDEDTAKDYKELEEIMKKAETVARRIDEKYNAANKAIEDVIKAAQPDASYGRIVAPLSIPGTVHNIIKQFENLHAAKKKGKRLW